MSGVFRAIGKVFKSVVKVVKKIALPVLMVGAVVLTGGAAIGALPAIGSVLGSIGISGTLASVLGGAISMGAVGAVTGGLKAAITGKDIMKGAVGGFVPGALTGGLLGGVGLISPNGILSDMGVGSTTAHLKGLADTGTLAKFAPNVTQADLAARGITQPGGGVSSVTRTGASLTQPNNMVQDTLGVNSQGPGIMGPTSAAPPVAAPASTGSGGLLSMGSGAALPPGFGGAGADIAMTGVGGAGAAAAASGGGSLLSAPSLLQLGGSIISGFAQGSASKSAAEAEAKALQDQYDRIARNYGVTNTYATDKKGRTIGGAPISQTMDYTYQPQNLANPNEGLLRSAFVSNYRVPYYQIVGGQVVQVGA